MQTNAIISPCANGLQKKAIEILTKRLLDQTGEYPIVLRPEEECPADVRRFIIGTRENNPAVRALSEQPLTQPEEYHICVQNNTVLIEGADEAGVLYGCVDFYNKYIAPNECTHDSGHYFRDLFAGVLPEFSLRSAPSVKRRGVWSWGHVIYDYRGFLDALVQLKMNTVILWNDYPPINARELVAYAHDAGIRVIWGFPWFWDTNCAQIDIEAALAGSDTILAQYERDYRDLGGDGIYFQSFTELPVETIGGVLVAEAVTELVNRTAAKFYEKYPDLELQFGLHADSVKNRLEFIQRVDARIRIVWENCGAFPFDYIPKNVENFAETADFVRTITHLRGEGERFGAVTKGLTKLDWGTFTHPRAAMLSGVSSPQRKENRIARKKRIWRYIQAYWITNAGYALDMVRLIAKETAGEGDISALIEDGMLEAQLPYPAALYAEMLWSCDTAPETLLSSVALYDWVDFM